MPLYIQDKYKNKPHLKPKSKLNTNLTKAKVNNRMSYDDLPDDYSEEEIQQCRAKKARERLKKAKDQSLDNSVPPEFLNNYEEDADEEYFAELFDWIKEQEEKSVSLEYDDSQDVSVKKHHKLSRGTKAKRKRSAKKREKFAQAILTGTIAKSKKNNSDIDQAFADALPQHAKTFEARRKARKTEINRARAAKIHKNTAGPTPSEQEESNIIEAEQSTAFWDRYDDAEEAHMQAAQNRLGEMYNYMCYEYDSDYADMCEHMRVGEMLGREHLANVNSSYCDYW